MELSVLVVDDDADIRIALVEILREKGFRVRQARDGLEALEKIVEEEPDVVILDLMMPVINGWDVLRALRNSRKDLPVVILSAVKADGCEDYIPKPVSLERLELLLDTIRARGAKRANPDTV